MILNLNNTDSVYYSSSECVCFSCNGVISRCNGPAREYISGERFWWVTYEKEPRRHREDGPAIEIKGHEEWFVFGEPISKEEFESKYGNKQH